MNKISFPEGKYSKSVLNLHIYFKHAYYITYSFITLVMVVETPVRQSRWGKDGHKDICNSTETSVRATWVDEARNALRRLPSTLPNFWLKSSMIERSALLVTICPYPERKDLCTNPESNMDFFSL